MRRRIAEAVDDLIDRHRLHDGGAPVDLSPLEGEFVPVVRELAGSGVRAFAVPPKGGAATERSPVHVVLDSGRHRLDRNVLYAHEVGHIVCGHLGSLRTLDAGDWWHDRDEREAWEVAAALLIPHEAFGWAETARDVARECRVPAWLVEMYPHGVR